MAAARQWRAIGLCLGLGLGCGRLASAADFTLTPDELEKVEHRQVVIRAKLDSAQRRGTVRAAVRIDAPPAVVFGMMTRCADAVKYVPHMRQCRVRARAADGSWQLVEHQIDFGWYAPRIDYVFRAELQADRSIDFRQVSGDFKANEGRWELEAADDGRRTLLRYRAYIDPPGYIPNWLARSTFRRELPQMLTELRKLCEAVPTLRAEARPSPH